MVRARVRVRVSARVRVSSRVRVRVNLGPPLTGLPKFLTMKPGSLVTNWLA